jgi:hypothetical protein
LVLPQIHKSQLAKYEADEYSPGHKRNDQFLKKKRGSMGKALDKRQVTRVNLYDDKENLDPVIF